MTYLRRLVWFLASRLFIVTMVLGLAVTVFYYAMNLTNIQVVLKDGMAARAKVIMMGDPVSGLTRYFQPAFLERDEMLNDETQPYDDYTIRGIDHRLEMGFLWTWPWDETVRVDIVERIPSIDGRAKGTRAEALIAERGASAVYPPQWRSARYRAVVVKDNGQWRIRSLTLIEYLDE